MKLLTFGIDHIDNDLFKPISNPIEFDLRNKPMGGLWGSPYKPNEKYPSDWVNFIDGNLSEEFKKFVGITYNLKSDLKILEIDTLNDYLEVLNNYGYVPFKKLSKKLMLNFEAIAKDYNVFHLSDNASIELRFLFGDLCTIAVDFFHYDVESYILFSLDCINMDSIEVITLPQDFWSIDNKDY